MFELKNGDIVPGFSIGVLRLGDDESSLLQRAQDFSIHELLSYTVYSGLDVEVWVNKTNKKISQILVFGSFNGKLMGQFGIGTYFSEIENFLGESVELVDEITVVYEFSSLPGICFELEDIDVPEDVLAQKPYEILAPIGSISVFGTSQFF